jgi:hypothetical protein
MSCGQSSCDIVLFVWIVSLNQLDPFEGSMTFSFHTFSYVALTFQHYFLKCKCDNSGKGHTTIHLSDILGQAGPRLLWTVALQEILPQKSFDWLWLCVMLQQQFGLYTSGCKVKNH